MRDDQEYQRSTGVETYNPADMSSAIDNQINSLKNFFNVGNQIVDTELKQRAQQDKYSLQAQLSTNANQYYNESISKYSDPESQQKYFNQNYEAYKTSQVAASNPFNKDFTKNMLDYYGNHYNSILQTSVVKQKARENQDTFSNNFNILNSDIGKTTGNLNFTLDPEERYKPVMTMYNQALGLNRQGFIDNSQTRESYERNKKLLQENTALSIITAEAKHAYDTQGIEGLDQFKKNIPQKVLNNFDFNEMQKIKINTEINTYIDQNVMSHELNKTQLNKAIEQNLNDLKLHGGEPNNNLMSLDAHYNGTFSDYTSKADFALKQHKALVATTTMYPDVAQRNIINPIKNTLSDEQKSIFDKDNQKAHEDMIANPVEYAMKNQSIQNIAQAQNNATLSTGKYSNSTQSPNAVPTPNLYDALLDWQIKMGLNGYNSDAKDYVKVFSNNDLLDTSNKLKDAIALNKPEDIRAIFQSQRQKINSPRAYNIFLNNLSKAGIPRSVGFIGNINPNLPTYKDVTTALIMPDNVLKDNSKNYDVVEKDSGLNKIDSELNTYLSDNSSDLRKYLTSINGTYGTINSEEGNELVSAIRKYSLYQMAFNKASSPSAAVDTAVKTLLSNYQFTNSGHQDLAIPSNYNIHKINNVIDSGSKLAEEFPFSYEVNQRAHIIPGKFDKENFKNIIPQGHFVMSSDHNSMIWTLNNGRIPVGKLPNETTYHPLIISLNDIENNKYIKQTIKHPDFGVIKYNRIDDNNGK